MSTEYIDTPVGWLEVKADTVGITHVTFVSHCGEVSPSSITTLAVTQLNEYLNGDRRAFSLPLNPHGTDFQRGVWHALMSIDYGKTTSYADIALRIGNKKACRAVGAANGKNPIGIIVPCHRVIGANGTLTGYAGGLERKQWLLSLERGDNLF
ncbi:methylated-DNA--[protein]-cysteine S-methyltransferase [Alteromonas oceanisediminis]|uniref:methylated-DNA--[protein]-cysteine S-methyltransferase n=1 Tax=Alteromonas oceanisediminis TaxID=2836180 RepID=UPI001BDA41B3|nr:methylated-DNA--[protein]-cysteine S-methyltransferase [Alteromonas oceanisediminis]MBT0586281.1 methylated-DNA--[protein]-cysteine S-methyltransferase [Alteromonas oceanisediminis]